MRIGLTEVFVDDQDKARAFYAGVLGLLVKDDANYGDTGRWLTIVSPEDPDGTELLLAPVNDAAVALQAARREAGRPAASFATEDCHRAYEELRGRGVVFLSEPQPMSYGGTEPCSRMVAATSSTSTRISGGPVSNRADSELDRVAATAVWLPRGCFPSGRG